MSGRTLVAPAFLLQCLCLAGTVHGQPVLYASTSGNFPAGGVVGTLNQTNADFTLLGDPTANGSLPAIAIDSSGQMFGSNNAGGSGSPGTLIRINPVNGTLLSTVGPIIDAGDMGALTVTDMDFQPGTDVLYAIVGRGSKEGFIYTINTATAAATKVGETGLERGGLAFAPGGTLYVATVGDEANAVIARVNPADASVIGSPVELSDEGIEGLAVRCDGVIFGTAADGGELYTIDPDTGQQTSMGNDDSPTSVADLSFTPGESCLGLTGVNAPALSQLALAALMLGLLVSGSIVLRRRQNN